MSETSQTHNFQDAWKKMMDDQVARVEQIFGEGGEGARWRQKGFEQAETAIDASAKLTKDTLTYVGQLSSEWQKLTLAAMRQAATFVTP